MRIAPLILSTLGPLFLMAQGSFAPNADQVGTTAIHKDSSVFIAWASECVTERGPQNIADINSPLVTSGDDNFAIGISGANGVLSLGDGGSATLTFLQPIINGIGPDFAIFENGFSNTFLELAFVEVSSDGVNFYRFNATSETQDTTQVGTFGDTEASMLNNLAGKYRAQFGTPFDLDELNGQAGLDINNITHVKVIDVVGSINENLGTTDFHGNKINDPYPTDFATGGFDLDAVGVIHQQTVSVVEFQPLFNIYPNPSSGLINVNSVGTHTLELINTTGEVIYQSQFTNQIRIDVSSISKGIYFAKVGRDTQRIVIL